MKMALVTGTGNHKGCPYDRFAGAYFLRKDRDVGSVGLPTNPGQARKPNSTTYHPKTGSPRCESPCFHNVTPSR